MEQARQNRALGLTGLERVVGALQTVVAGGEPEPEEIEEGRLLGHRRQRLAARAQERARASWAAALLLLFVDLHRVGRVRLLVQPVEHVMLEGLGLLLGIHEAQASDTHRCQEGSAVDFDHAHGAPPR